MGVNVFEWQDSIRWDDLGPLLIDKAHFARWMGRVMGKNVQPAMAQTPPNLQQRWVDLYSEQVTCNAAADIDRYFVIKKNKGLSSTPAGLATHYPPHAIQPPPFAIQSGEIRPSNTAISALGEGLAGWYLEQRGMLPLSRPVGLPVDMLFRTQPWHHEVLVQVKATQEPMIVGRIREAGLPFLDYAFHQRDGLVSPICYIIGLIIRAIDNFDLLSLRIEMR